MRIVRTFKCEPMEFFEAVGDRFRRECSAHCSTNVNKLDVGVGYEDAGSTTRLDIFEPTKRFGWTASSANGRVVSLLDISDDDSGCRVQFDQDYFDQPGAVGKLGQALIYGQMSNMLIGIFEDVERYREGVVAEVPSPQKPHQSLSFRLFKLIFMR